MKHRILIATSTLMLLLVPALVVSAQKKPTKWIQGTWEGTGYQIDDQSTWTMRLTAKGRKFSIEYPSLNCGGTWQLLVIDKYQARFKERLTHGTERCALSGNVTLRRLSNNQAVFLYANAGTREISASSVLKRKSSRQ